MRRPSMFEKCALRWPSGCRRPVRSRPQRLAVAAATASLCAGLLLLAGAAHAEEDALARATRLIGDRQPQAAYDLLAAQEAARAGDPAFDYLLGVAALDAGHLTRAIFALERVLAVAPGNQPARAELGRAYLAAGESDSARRELQQVRRTENLPPEASAAIDRVLGALDQVAPAAGPTFSGYLALGGGRDSNVNSATNAGEFAIPAFGGLLFTVDALARRQHDLFASVAAGGSMQTRLDAEWSLLAAVNGSGAVNRHLHDMNTSLVDGTAGVSHADGANVQTLALQSNRAWLGSRAYRTANGATGQWQAQLDAASQASVFVQWSRQEYAGQQARNTDRSVVGAAYARAFEATGSLVYGSLYGARERARTDGYEFNGHHAAGLRLGGEQKLGDRTVAFAEWQQERRRYGGAEPLFDRRRRDRQDDLLLGLRWLPAPQWQVVPQLHLTRAGSNVTLYDYRRNVVQVVVRKDF